MIDFSLLPSTLEKEPSYEAAKWLKSHVLLDDTEITELFTLLGSFELYRLGVLLEPEQLCIEKNTFIDALRVWSWQLQAGRMPSPEDLKKILPCALTADRECLWLQKVGAERYLVRIKKPVIQIQAHFFSYSFEDRAFHSMVFGKESIFWGIQFSFPQIFMNPEIGDLCKVDSSFINTALYKQIRVFLREKTHPMSFELNKVKITVPMRLGKRCFSWIHQHPQLTPNELIPISRNNPRS